MVAARLVEVARSNNPVLVSFVQALLKDEGIDSTVADQNMAVIEGTITVWRRRVLVHAGDEERARRVIDEAELDAELG